MAAYVLELKALEEYDDGVEGAGAYPSSTASEMLVGLPMSDSWPQPNVAGVATGDCVGLPGKSGSNAGRWGLEKVLAASPNASEAAC